MHSFWFTQGEFKLKKFELWFKHRDKAIVPRIKEFYILIYLLTCLFGGLSAVFQGPSITPKSSDNLVQIDQVSAGAKEQTQSINIL